MIAAYQNPQPGSMHPGMAHVHPGMAPTPGQHMGQPMMHGGQPHVTQGGAMMAMQPGANGMSGPVMSVGQHPGAAQAMIGMPQPGQPGQVMGGQGMAGAGPNGRIMGQMTPQQMMQQHQLQQQMQAAQAAQQSGNPQLALQHQQAILQRQQHLARQAQASGMMGMHPSMQNLTPQQLAQFQQASQGMGQGLLPPHLATAQMVLQQQHQQAAAQQNHQNQLAAQMAMQHANSQQSNPGQVGPANQAPNQAHQPQMRPQSRLANRNEQNQGTPQQQQQQQQPGVQQPNQPQSAAQVSQQPQQQQPPPPPQPQQPPQQQQSQAQPPHPVPQGQPQPGQQNVQQTQQPPVAQTSQGGPPGQPQMSNAQAQQLAQGQAQGLTPQQQQQMVQRRIMQQRFAFQQQQQAQQSQQSGNFVLRIMLFGSQLSSFNATNGKDISQWNEFINRHFAPDGRLLHSFDDGNPNSKSKTYEVLRPTIARYFWTYFDSGATSLRLHFEHARETPIPPNRMQVSCPHATLTVSYPSGAKLEMSGSLNVLFAPVSNIIESLEIQQTSIEETISRAEVEKVLNNYSPSLSNKASPKLTKKNLPKGQQKMQQYEGLSIDHFPRVPKGSMGVTSRVQQFLEIGETMNVMSDLMSYANESKLRPEPALDQLVQQYEMQGMAGGHANSAMHYAPNGIPMGQRTPSMQNMQMPNQFSSPSMPNLNLPMQNGMNGSPHITHNPGLQSSIGMQGNSHTPSPHQSNMAAPSMIPQHSQQGTNSSVASTNTSPNVNNKRRRSTVKVEEEGVNQAGEGGNAGRVKPSPRINKKSKPGG